MSKLPAIDLYRLKRRVGAELDDWMHISGRLQVAEGFLIGPRKEKEVEEEEKELKPRGLRGLKTPRLVLANIFIGLKVDLRELLSDSSSSPLYFSLTLSVVMSVNWICKVPYRCPISHVSKDREIGLMY